jgi:hypothetical protein
VLQYLPFRNQCSPLEEDLARSPELLDQALNQEIGSVTLPPFHTKVERDLTPHLKQLGVRKAFQDLGSLFTFRILTSARSSRRSTSKLISWESGRTQEPLLARYTVV